MAGPQASKTLAEQMTRGYKHYNVPDHNKPVSATYFNLVKAHMLEKMPEFCAKAIRHFGERQWWNVVREEMDKYTFGFEANQALYIYAKYKKVV